MNLKLNTTTAATAATAAAATAAAAAAAAAAAVEQPASVVHFGYRSTLMPFKVRLQDLN